MTADTDATESPHPEPLGPIRASERAAALVDRMCQDLGLWRTPAEACMFLAALAAAHKAQPADPSELGNLTAIADADGVDGAREGLAVLSLVDEDAASPASLLKDKLPAWIEAGTDVLAPVLEGASLAQATAEIATLVDDLGSASE